MQDLPRKLNKREAKVTPKIMEWFFVNYPYDVCVEVKVDKNKVKEHQQAALNAVKNGTFKWKIPDLGSRNPFDFIILKTGKVHAIWFVWYPLFKTFWFKDLNNDEEHSGKLST